jgi:hypothetical protein
MEQLQRLYRNPSLDRDGSQRDQIHRRQSLAQAAEWTASPRGAVQSAHIVSMVTASVALPIQADLSAQARALALNADVTRQCDPLRDIFGNPFRSVTVDPAWLEWRDGLVKVMARKMWETGEFSDFPILADALEEAGCANEDILTHSRQSGEHVRGCWLVDLLLGKV